MSVGCAVDALTDDQLHATGRGSGDDPDGLAVAALESVDRGARSEVRRVEAAAEQCFDRCRPGIEDLRFQLGGAEFVGERVAIEPHDGGGMRDVGEIPPPLDD